MFIVIFTSNRVNLSLNFFLLSMIYQLNQINLTIINGLLVKNYCVSILYKN